MPHTHGHVCAFHAKFSGGAYDKPSFNSKIKKSEKKKFKTQLKTKCRISRGMLQAALATASLWDKDPG